MLTAALAEEDGDDPRVPSATAVRTAGRWVLSGVKTAVPAAPRADLFLVPATTSDGVTGVPGLAVGCRGVRRAAAADGLRRGRAGRAGRRHAGRRPGARPGAGRPGHRLAGVAGHRGAVRAAGRGPGAGAGTDRGVRAEPGAVRPADRLVPGGDAAPGRRLHRHRSGPAHHVAGRLAAWARATPGLFGSAPRWPRPSSGPPTPATGWRTPRSTCTAGWASTCPTRCTATSWRPSTTSSRSAAPPPSSAASAPPWPDGASADQGGDLFQAGAGRS